METLTSSLTFIFTPVNSRERNLSLFCLTAFCLTILENKTCRAFCFAAFHRPILENKLLAIPFHCILPHNSTCHPFCSTALLQHQGSWADSIHPTTHESSLSVTLSQYYRSWADLIRIITHWVRYNWNWCNFFKHVYTSFVFQIILKFEETVWRRF